MPKTGVCHHPLHLTARSVRASVDRVTVWPDPNGHHLLVNSVLVPSLHSTDCGLRYQSLSGQIVDVDI